MAVVMQVVFEGRGLSDYVPVNAQVIEAGEPDGLLFHSAGEGPDGLTIVDVWESGEASDAFFRTQLQPILAGSAMAGVQPRVTSWELGNVWLPDGNALTGMNNFGMS